MKTTAKIDNINIDIHVNISFLNIESLKTSKKTIEITPAAETYL